MLASNKNRHELIGSREEWNAFSDYWWNEMENDVSCVLVGSKYLLYVIEIVNKTIYRDREVVVENLWFIYDVGSQYFLFSFY